ncbi:MAG: glycosyltransferase [Microcoleaceae cyanobacterium]
MKIAIITSGFLPVVDGVTVGSYYRLKKLSQWGHQVLLFCPDYQALASVYPEWQEHTGEILPGVRVINLESTSFMGLDFERNVNYRSYSVMLKALKNFAPDIIHVEEPERLFVGFFRVPGVKFAQQHNIPCVACFRTNFLEYADDFFDVPAIIIKLIQSLFKILLRFVYNSYDITLVPSEVTQKKLVKLGIKNSKYIDLNGFDSKRFDCLKKEQFFFENNYSIKNINNKIKIIFVGRLTPDKGWKFTLNVYPKLVQQIDPEKIALIIVGDGSMGTEIAQKLSQFTPYVYLLGRVSPSKIPALLINSDIYITTSEKENRAVTLIEAFAAALPVLAPRAGGLVQDIQDGKNGYLFEPQNQEDFIQKLKQLVENDSLRKEMGSEARKYISQYTWEYTVNNLQQEWQRQIQKKMKLS